MKYNQAIGSILLAASIGLSISACGDKKSESKSSHNDHDMTEMEGMKDMSEENVETTVATPMITKESAQQVLSAYLSIKDALVETDGTTASTAATTMIPLLNGSDELSLRIKVNAEYIAATNDAEVQRSAFNKLSEDIYTLVKSTEANDAPLYRQYCPMAMDNQGAYWLSSEKEVLNPYFGDKMLRCGSVKEEI
ncbi:DUF3347 domain-containing protein [Gilvimarinus agarilyticus]|uniref:DUF3347 domain-containing protein n=1 Tax=Reichenbachiella agariperforans TaxID=156994 RepID=UPI001C089036|nr:DUF3347 domain-containing protein [Reichenbachiella agariperforans]MBU2884910.1 DUF3347 domain-containing protein [Gilvimarinus agarilyticus]MBU2915010.1 DUF3347 domain-containing protein [Reichenbachiella agariperforans]